jgi:hypothetical protein
MEAPDWYPEWRHEAVHQLQSKIGELKREYRLGDWPRYDYDLTAGTLTFSEDGVVRVIARIQVVGTTSFKAGNWLWAWANAYWPAQLTTDSELVRTFGTEHAICQLTHDYVEDDDLNGLGWELTAVMVRLTNALGAYRPRHEGGGLYLTYKSIAWAE